MIRWDGFMGGKHLLLTIALILNLGCSTKGQDDRAEKSGGETVSKAKITFIELGSVNCIPCKAMQPVMRAIQQRYGHQIEIIFYDVWKPEQKHYAQKYGIRLIPTQVFLDGKGAEIMRHEGFFPMEEMVAFLESQGLAPVPTD
ncbi:thioredoxin family protein [Candidatus Neomarinimicrobiota bacterium]